MRCGRCIAPCGDSIACCGRFSGYCGSPDDAASGSRAFVGSFNEASALQRRKLLAAIGPEALKAQEYVIDGLQ